MKLYYSGNHSKIERIVNRSNKLIVSPFYIQELEKHLMVKCRAVQIEFLKGLLERDEEIMVKGYFNIFSRECMKVKPNFIAVNTCRLNVSHRDLLALLTENMFRIMDSEKEISSSLKFSNQNEMDTFFKEIGMISKSYI